MFRRIKVERTIVFIIIMMGVVLFFFKNILPKLVLDILAYVAVISGTLFLLIKGASDLIKYLKKVKVNKQFRRLVDEGTELLNSKQYKKAAEVLEQALVLHPKSAELLGYIGSAYLNLKDYNNAIKFSGKP